MTVATQKQDIFKQGINSFGKVSWEQFSGWVSKQTGRKNAARDLKNLDDDRIYSSFEVLDNTFSSLYPVLGQLNGLKFCPVASSTGASFNGQKKYKIRLGSQFSKFSGKCQDRETIGEITKDLLKWGNLLDRTENSSLYPVSLGVMPGWVTDASGTKQYLFCLDLDNKDHLEGKLEGIVASIFKMGFKTFTVKTPSGGYHLYFFSSKQEGNSPLCHRVDVRGLTYWMAPGTITEKGTYTVSNGSAICSVPSDWRNLLAPLFGTNPTGTKFKRERREDSISGTFNKPCIPETSLSFKDMFNQGYVPEGSRHSYLFWSGSYLVGSRPTDSLESLLSLLMKERDRVGISSEEFNEKVLENMLTWSMKKQAINGSKQNQREEKRVYLEHSPKSAKQQGIFSKTLVEFFSSKPKTEDHTVKLSDISPIVQAYYESKGFKYTKDIAPQAVAKILVEAGFSKKRTRFNGQNNWFWNISQDSLDELVAMIVPQAIQDSINSSASTTPTSTTPQAPVAPAKQSDGLRCLPCLEGSGEAYRKSYALDTYVSHLNGKELDRLTLSVDDTKQETTRGAQHV